MSHLLVLHGPNLNLLGSREPDVYGVETLKDINESLKKQAENLGHQLTTLQSNAEHELVDKIQAAPQAGVDFIIINPAALTHTSIAIRDAFSAVNIPFIEIHISNVFQRESFRHHSFLSDIAQSVICGCGTYGYQLALLGANNHLTNLSS